MTILKFFYENLPNTTLELIKAPLAWSITQGDPNILVGVVDSYYDLDHEELQGKIALNMDDSADTYSHGTGVASSIAGNTDNGVGIASIGYKTR